MGVLMERNMKEITNKIIIFIGVVVLMLCIYTTHNIFVKNKYLNKSLPEVKLKETKDMKSFAIMIQNENGYEEYNKNTWPTEE